MKPEFTASGVQVQTYQEIYDELVAGYQAIYGADITVSPDSPDGQRIAIEAQARLDLQTFGLTLTSQFDPDFAIGTQLNKLLKLTGILRRPATRSQVDVAVTTDRPLTLPDDYAVEDALGQTWLTLSEVILVSGANTVTLFAENFGAVEADSSTVNIPVTVVIGVLSVNNPAAATVGVDEETDEELRIRRNRSLENPARSTVGRMFAALSDLSGVTGAEVYENDQDVQDVERDIAPHTIWAVVEGGSVADIAETMTKNKTGGTGTKGGVTGTYIETRTRPDGSTFDVVHEMRFDRPTLVPVYVNVTATRKNPTVPVDTAALADKIASATFNIGENILASELYEIAYDAGDGFILTGMEVSNDDVIFTDESLVSAPDGRFTIDSANVTVTEVTP